MTKQSSPIVIKSLPKAAIHMKPCLAAALPSGDHTAHAAPDELDIEKEITVSGPCECGTIAVPCSIKKILEKQLFFCEACGTEFSGEDAPALFTQTGSSAQTPEDRQLFADMREVYSWIYGASTSISIHTVARLCKNHPQYLELFPISAWPPEIILSRLADDQKFAEEFREKYAQDYQWHNLTAQDWLVLFSAIPEMAEKCERWNDFTPEQWRQIKSRFNSLYEKYFNKKYLTAENYLKCIVQEPDLLEKVIDDVKYTLDDVKYEVTDAAETIADAAKNFWRKLW